MDRWAVRMLEGVDTPGGITPLWEADAHQLMEMGRGAIHFTSTQMSPPLSLSSRGLSPGGG